MKTSNAASGAILHDKRLIAWPPARTEALVHARSNANMNPAGDISLQIDLHMVNLTFPSRKTWAM
jgi:hypothetical protein